MWSTLCALAFPTLCQAHYSQPLYQQKPASNYWTRYESNRMRISCFCWLMRNTKEPFLFLLSFILQQHDMWLPLLVLRNLMVLHVAMNPQWLQFICNTPVRSTSATPTETSPLLCFRVVFYWWMWYTWLLFVYGNENLRWLLLVVYLGQASKSHCLRLFTTLPRRRVNKLWSRQAEPGKGLDQGQGSKTTWESGQRLGWGSSWETSPSMTWVWSQIPQALSFPVASKYQGNLIAHKEGRNLLLMPVAPKSSVLQRQIEISIHVADLWHSLENYSLSKHVQADECSFQLASWWYYCLLYNLTGCQCVNGIILCVLLPLKQSLS